MPGQIPQALGVLSEFLGQENARLEAEIKKDNIQKTIQETAKQFADLDPEASQQDVRGLYYRAIQTAGKNEAEEIIPFITQMFTQSANFIREEKETAQGEEFVDRAEDITGLRLQGLGPAGAKDIAGLDARTTQFITTQNRVGQSFMQAYKFREGQFQPFGGKINIIESTFAGRDQYRQGQYAPKSFQQGRTRVRNTVTDEILVGTFDPASGLMMVQEGNQLRPMNENETLDPETSSPSLTRQRSTKDAESQYEFNLALLRSQSRDMAKELKNAKYDIGSSDYLNLVSNQTLPEAFENIKNESGLIAEHISKMSDLGKRERLKDQFIDFMNQSARLDAATDELNRWYKASPFRKKEGVVQEPFESEHLPEENVINAVDSIIQGGPQHATSGAQWHKLNKRVQKDMNMSLQVLADLKSKGLLSFEQTLQWNAILAKLKVKE